MHPAVLAASVMLAAASSADHAWQFIGASNDLAMFVDDTSTVVDGAKRQVWVIGIPDARSAVSQRAPNAYVMSLHRVDCTRQTDAVLHFAVYSDGGDILGERENTYPESPVAPYSAGELIYAYVCKGSITTDKIVKLHSLAEVKSVGRAWLETYDRLEAMERQQQPRR